MAAAKAVAPAKAPVKKRKASEPPEPELPAAEPDVAFQTAAIEFCFKQMERRITHKISMKKLKKEDLFGFILAF
eukprot:3463380-Prymnesium_polylepis.1